MCAQTDLLISGGVVLWCGFVEGPLVVRVIIHPLTEMVPKIKAPKKNNKICSQISISERDIYAVDVSDYI